jgi:hypothetical protein
MSAYNGTGSTPLNQSLPSNGTIGQCATPMMPGQQCTVECSQGYVLQPGSTNYTCGEDGSYTPTVCVVCM